MLVLIVLQSPGRMLMVDPWGAWKRTETADWPPGGAAPPAGTAPEQAGSSGLTGALCGLQHLGSVWAAQACVLHRSAGNA